jgi:two-component system, NtrC family, response regulator AtoC
MPAQNRIGEPDFKAADDQNTASRPVSARRILLISGDLSSSRNLAAALKRRDVETTSTSSLSEATRILRQFQPTAVVADADTLDAAFTESLDLIRRPGTPLLVISGHSTPEQVFRLSKMGADDFLPKPVDATELEIRINRIAAEVGRNEIRQQQSAPRPDFSMLFGASAKMEDVRETIDKVADTNATVLIRGESGTGKEMVARTIYSQSSRRDKPFVKVNCAAIPNDLLESELFGYEQGAFTGATRQKLGKFDQANNGTLFLDEISEMHPSLQAKLLHVLQDGEFSRLGGKHDIAVDVRVLAATNKPLERAVSDGTFREDLFYRLNVVSIHIPPLRERREEIPVFIDFFLNKYSNYYNKRPTPFSEAAVQRMMNYDWPGNIRELENLVKRYTIVGNEAQIIRELATHKPIVTSTDIDMASASMKLPARHAQEEQPSLLEIGRRAAQKAEREAIERVLMQTKWNRRQAAKILKVSYKALLNKLKLIEEEQEQVQSEQRPA